MILRSKIMPPGQEKFTIEKLAARLKLEKAPKCAITTVVAPAGFGKTTAVGTWTSSLKDVSLVWVSLEAQDGCIGSFWSYLLEAFSIGGLESVVPVKEEPYSLNLLNLFINQLSSYSGEVVCVLENYHTVQYEKSICSCMNYFTKHLPSNVHIVLTSRCRLNLSLASLQLKGSLNEIVETDLAFTLDEQRRLCAHYRIDLKEFEANCLYEYTRGWPAAIQFAIQQYLRSESKNIKESISESQIDVDDYLYQEVFVLLDENLQDFMVRTSLPKSFCLSLAEVLCESSRGETAELLDRLIERNLFIERAESQNGNIWYAYHPLVSNMLATRLKRLSKETKIALSRTSRDWFEKNGFHNQAVVISAEIEDYERIKDIILSHWRQLYMSDSHHTLASWASYLPYVEITSSPLICAIVTMPHALEGDFVQAEALLHIAFASLHEEDDSLAGVCWMQKAFIAAFKGDSFGMRSYSSKALSLLPEEELYLRAMMMQINASSYIEEASEKGKALFERAAKEQVLYGNKNLACSAFANLAFLCANLGHLEEALQYVKRAFRLYDETEKSRKGMLGWVYVAKMICDYERGSLEDCLAGYEAFKGLVQYGAVKSLIAEGDAIYSKVLMRQGSTLGEQVFFDALVLGENSALLSFPSLTMVRMYCQTFNAEASQRSTCIGDTSQMKLFNYAICFHLDRISVFEDLCLFVDSISENEKLARVHGYVLAAVFAEKVARMRSAESYFEQAVRIALAWGLHSAIEDNVLYVKHIAQRLISQSDTDVLSYLVEHVEKVDVFSKSDIALTERELGVMRLMASGLTVAQAAEHLFVSRETVKKHLANIYAKLGVHSKMQAVAFLREKNII